MQNEEIKNVTDLRNVLIKSFEKLRSKEIGLSEAKEMANVSGKILSSAKIQLEYNRYCGSKDEVNFLKGS